MCAQEEGSPSTAFFFVCECWEVEQSSSSRQLCTEKLREGGWASRAIRFGAVAKCLATKQLPLVCLIPPNNFT